MRAVVCATEENCWVSGQIRSVSSGGPAEYCKGRVCRDTGCMLGGGFSETAGICGLWIFIVACFSSDG